jgi:hypothetical protein
MTPYGCGYSPVELQANDSWCKQAIADAIAPMLIREVFETTKVDPTHRSRISFILAGVSHANFAWEIAKDKGWEGIGYEEFVCKFLTLAAQHKMPIFKDVVLNSKE